MTAWEACVGFWDCAGVVVSNDVFRNLSFLVGVAVAVVSVLSARSTAKKKQSADLLSSTKNDEELIQGLRTLASLHNRPDSNIRQYAQDDKTDSDEARSIRYVLNHWEYVSVGIQGGIYHEGMLKKASHGSLVNLFEHAQPFINRLREIKNRPSIYQEMEELAERWKREGPPKKKKGWLGLF